MAAAVLQSTAITDDVKPATDPTKDKATLAPHAAAPVILTGSPVSMLQEASPAAPTSSISPHAINTSSPSGSRPPSYLATSRPAPASPASSRPASIHRSRSGSNASNVERSRKPRPRSSLGIDMVSAQAGSSSKEPPKLKIRDYGFENSDVRYSGVGPDAQGNKTSYRKPVEEDDSSGRGGWGRIFGGFRRRGRGRSDEDADEEPDVDLEQEADVTYVDMDDDDEDEDELSDTESHPTGPDPAGWYRAMYAFEAVGEHEMGLAEGEVVDVLGRGGGSGWVVAVKRGEVDVEGLVPEGYLKKLREGEEEEEWGGEEDDEDDDEGLGLGTGL